MSFVGETDDEGKTMFPAALFAAFTFAQEPLDATPSIDVPIIVGSGGLFLALYLGPDRQQNVLFPPYAPPSGIDSLARAEKDEGISLISDVALYGSLGAGIAANLLNASSGHRTDRLLLYTEALAIDGAIVELTKWAVRRPRPYASSGETDDPDDGLSFPSGHTAFMATVAFTTARSLDLTTPLEPGEKIVLYGSATALTVAIGTLRVAAGMHHPSDVIAGACIGGAIGWLVPELHRGVRH